MRCPKCGSRTKDKEFQGTCSHCGFRFLFSRYDLVRDRQWRAILAKTSQSGNCHFTDNQLYGNFVRQTSKNTFRSLWPLLFLLPLTVLAFFGVRPEILVVFFVIILVTTFEFYSKATPPVRVTREKFNAVIDKWAERHDSKLRITEPVLNAPPPEFAEQDLYDYGVEYLLILDRSILVDLFVRNDFHSREKTLILSRQEYPHYLVPRARKLLKENPNQPVFYLHGVAPNEGPAGLQTIASILQVDPGRIFDMGLTSRDLRKVKQLRPFRTDPITRVPLDYLSWGNLAAATAQALREKTTLAHALQNRSQHDGGYG